MPKKINETKLSPQPFLQWVGGKRKVTKQLIQYIPQGLNNYYEPFLGGGALFFQVKPIFKHCFLSDINLELVTSYNAVKQNPAKVAELLNSHTGKHSKEYYYQLRDINNASDPHAISARFLYLNRYAFRAIYRLNRDGKLMSSFSTKNYPYANASDNLNKCSNYLQDVSIYAGDFSFIDPKAGDFVYFDPPYHKAGEEFYTTLPFDESQQIRLRDFAKDLGNKGVKVMLSNSDTEFIRNLYNGFSIKVIQVKYDLPKNRKNQNELLITNY